MIFPDYIDKYDGSIIFFISKKLYFFYICSTCIIDKVVYNI